jgi:hypothetical protein
MRNGGHGVVGRAPRCGVWEGIGGDAVDLTRFRGPRRPDVSSQSLPFISPSSISTRSVVCLRI